MNKMNVELYRKAKMLVVGDSEEEIQAIQNLLHEDGFMSMSTKHETEAIEMFKARKPVVLIISYFDVVQAERFYTKLHRSGKEIDAIPHRTLLLCRGNHAQQAFELCLEGVVDDYVVSRPLIDPFRLRLSVYQALNECSLSEDLRALTEKVESAGDEWGKMDEALAQAAAKGGLGGEAFKSFMESAQKLSAKIGRPRPEESEESQKKPGDARPKEGDAGPQPLFQRDAASLGPTPSVLLVEDEPTYRSILKKILEESALRVIEAEDGVQALAVLKSERPNLIFLDLMMPNLDGLETLKMIKANPLLKSIPIVMLTGMSEKDVVRECIRQGAVDFVVKPSNRPTLLQKVETHMRKPGVAEKVF
jgi:CheY-like chemotaxis protein